MISIVMCVVLLGCTERLPKDMQRSLDVAIAYVEHYRSSNSKLPDRDQFLDWSKTNQLVGVVDFRPVENKRAGDYCIYIWRGERMLIYSSREKTVHEAR